jgi:hypothetical protein
MGDWSATICTFVSIKALTDFRCNAHSFDASSTNSFSANASFPSFITAALIRSYTISMNAQWSAYRNTAVKGSPS